jgi:radical SAM-linked protein
MKVSFDNPLPVGMESQEEFFTLHADSAWKPADLARALNTLLPDILPVTGCAYHSKGAGDGQPGPVSYRVTLHGHTPDPGLIREFMTGDEHLVEQTSHKGVTRSLDLRKSVQRMDILDSDTLEMVLISVGTRTVRPTEILTQVLRVPEEVVRTADILKLKPRSKPC